MTIYTACTHCGAELGVKKGCREDAPAKLFCPKCGIEPAPRQTVDHPPHYGGPNNTYEAIKVIEAWGLGFCLGNALKYIARCDHKGTPLEDLEKARWYIEREIQQRKLAE